jgi:hypothetical protein
MEDVINDDDLIPGYYWVKYNFQWEIGEYCSGHVWKLTGVKAIFYTNEFNEIDKQLLVRGQIIMDESKAREILDKCRDRSLGPYFSLDIDSGGEICLDGYFTIDELEAIAWWMRNKGEK